MTGPSESLVSPSDVSVIEEETTPSTGRPSYFGRLRKKPSFWLSVSWLVIVIVISVGAPLFAPFGSNAQNLNELLAGPSWHHLLGTDDVGRDILSRLMYGGALSLEGTAWTTVVALAIGLPFGVVAGYFGGWWDSLANRFADLMFSVPGVLILLAVEAIFGSNQWIVMGVLGVILSAPFIRLVSITCRGAKGELYVDAAQVAGLSHARIIVRHIVPNIAAPIVILTSSTLSFALLVETGLGFLGLGPQPPTPSWGEMVATASSVIYSDRWMMVPTGAVLILTVLSFNFIGDAVRDASPGSQRSGILQLQRGRKLKNSQSARLLTPPPAADSPTIDLEANPSGSVVGSPLLHVEGLRVAFAAKGGDVAVVDGISFDVHRGETLGIVGESGCGKTMTALALLGLVPPPGRVITGSVRFDNLELTALDERTWAKIRGARIGYVAQEPMVALDPSFTIGSQLVEPIRHHIGLGRRDAKRRAIELLNTVGIPQPDAIFRSYPHQISGGMAQRVAIAIALSGEPELLIADEPTTALDVTVQGEILDLLRSLQEKLGMSLILVTHNLGVVADICDRALVMYAGQIVEDGAVQDLFDRPSNPYTEGLLKSAPEYGEIGADLPTIRGTVPLPAEWPRGCRFAPRCPYALDQCSAAPVPMASLASGQRSRCIRIEEIFPREHVKVRSS